MEADMKYELKALKTLNTSDGVAWTASLYKDGKRIATVENKGDGGSTWAYGLSSAESVELTSWTRENCAGSWVAEFINEPTSSDIELSLDFLYDIAINNKEARKSLVIRVRKGRDEYGMVNEEHYRLRGYDESCVPALKSVMQQHPTAEVWSTFQCKYVPVAEMVA
jgi:hypothetical protein